MIAASFFACLVFILAFSATYLVYKSQKLRLKTERHGCQPAARYIHVDPIFGLDIFLRTGYAAVKNQLLSEHQMRYDIYGHTFEALNFGSRTIYSIHPDNLKAVWSQNATDWGVEPLRLRKMYPFCGSGFITNDGAEWKRSHALLRPGFHKSNISDLTSLETQFQIMLKQIPKDGSTFDLQPWLLKLYLDMNTLFLFGETIGVLSGDTPSHAEGFLSAFREGFEGCGIRIALGPLACLMPNKTWYQACEKTHQFADVYVDRALHHRQKQKSTEKLDQTTKQRNLLHQIAMQTDDRRVLRHQIIQAMMAATETTASLISNVVHILAAHPDVFAKVRAEVLSVGDDLLGNDSLSRLKYTQNVIREALRLYPVFPQNNRVALKDTILPTGGGLDRTSPIFAPAGTLFDTSFAALHRDKSIWGPDADQFRPERWNSDSGPTPFEYMPFGAGPRQCLAQRKATMETSYIVARLLQEFQEIQSRDARPYQAQVALTAKNANGCLVSLVPVERKV